METIRFGDGPMVLQNMTFVRTQETENDTSAQGSLVPGDVAGQEADSSVGWQVSIAAPHLTVQFQQLEPMLCLNFMQAALSTQSEISSFESLLVACSVYCQT